jgi:hypothetical protein
VRGGSGVLWGRNAHEKGLRLRTTGPGCIDL